ncbi:hypothetical protein DT076_01065 [Desertihabitans brevis]|uniref:Aminoglycoside phosphotransferase family protein n=1 Tax=Desertihabitans brevis TaxID=2268447 RepID=A0A367YYV2_9ACTN|nr:hypothetical protein [Desertihabitans brevis]RCK71093.1 hypothetical protein DT076_01065 [Desertihabitans brevis]
MRTEEQIHLAAADAVAPGSRVGDVRAYRRHPLPFPARLTVITPAGPVECVAKAAPAASSRLDVEATALRLLSEVGARSPRLLAGPVPVQTDSGPFHVLVMTPLPGEVLPWLQVPDLATGDRTCRLWTTAVEELHVLTEPLAALPGSRHLARRTLDDELADVLAGDSDRISSPLADRAIELLGVHLAVHRRPLVFSNGDLNPLNVLTEDGGRVGWVDFEHAVFEDPLIGLPKFWFWADDPGWATGARLGLVERYLYRHRVPAETFAVRILLRGLTHLRDTDPEHPPQQLVTTLEHAVDVLAR